MPTSKLPVTFQRPSPKRLTTTSLRSQTNIPRPSTLDKNGNNATSPSDKISAPPKTIKYSANKLKSSTQNAQNNGTKEKRALSKIPSYGLMPNHTSMSSLLTRSTSSDTPSSSGKPKSKLTMLFQKSSPSARKLHRASSHDSVISLHSADMLTSPTADYPQIQDCQISFETVETGSRAQMTFTDCVPSEHVVAEIFSDVVRSVAFKMHISPKLDRARRYAPVIHCSESQEIAEASKEERQHVNENSQISNMPDVIPQTDELRNAITSYSSKIVNSFSNDPGKQDVGKEVTTLEVFDNEDETFIMRERSFPSELTSLKTIDTFSGRKNVSRRRDHLDVSSISRRAHIKGFLTTRQEIRDSVDSFTEKSAVDNTMSPPLSPTYTGPLSKIGTPRILTRPQESPPRTRKFSTPPPNISVSNNPTALHKQALMRSHSNRLTQSLVIQADDPHSSRVVPSHSSPREDDLHDDILLREDSSSRDRLLSPPLEECDINRYNQPDTRPNSNANSLTSKSYSPTFNRSYRHSSQTDASGKSESVNGSLYSAYGVKMRRGNTMTERMDRMRSERRKRKGSIDVPTFITDFASTLRIGLPAAPELSELRIPESAVMNQQSSQLSKVSVAVRLKPTNTELSSSYLTVNTDKNQIILRDPGGTETNIAPSCRRQLASIPKLFVFDHVFPQHVQQNTLCENSMWEIVQTVLQGSDGCVISFGQARTGKTHSMIGTDSSCLEFGVIPTALSWLYHLIGQRSQTARVSVRMSALQIRGADEKLHDLLVSIANPGHSQESSANLKLKESRVYGTQVDNLTELRAQDVNQAGFYLDAALYQSSQLNASAAESERGVHSIFTVDIYQHHLEKPNTQGGALVAGGRSRLHFIDIGACIRSTSTSGGTALSLAALGSTLKCLLNGQRHYPHKDSVLASLLKESVGSPSCRTCLLFHASTQPSQYSETLQILQLAASIHRMKIRRRNKFGSSNSSDGSASTNSRLRRRGIKMGTSASYSDPDVSSSEQSVDTVIYVSKQRSDLYCSPNHSRVNYSRGTPHHTAPVQSSPSPYQYPGAVKAKVSDEETSSEGRRRMPRTNVRVWPKTAPPVLTNAPEHWVDAPPTASYQPMSYQEPNQQPMNYQERPQQHHHQNPYQNPVLLHNQGLPPPWISLGPIPDTHGQYCHPQQAVLNHPTQNGHIMQPPHPHQPQASAPAQQSYPGDTTRQELWIDGPTAFTSGPTRNGPTSPQPDSLNSPSPSRKQAPGGKHYHTERCKHRNGSLKKHHRDSPTRYKTCKDCNTDNKQDVDNQDIIIKPFVKDWVMRHSSMTPSKRDKTKPGVSQIGEDNSHRQEQIDDEMNKQDLMQLTIDLQDGDDVGSPTVDLVSPVSIHADDSVSQVTADSRVGYESKDGSVADDRSSLTGELVEVCDVACQTEFTDSETQSLDDLDEKNKQVEEPPTVVESTPTIRQPSLLRRPDGASDPNLHKESFECNLRSRVLLSDVKSSSLPRTMGPSKSELPNKHQVGISQSSSTTLQQISESSGPALALQTKDTKRNKSDGKSQSKLKQPTNVSKPNTEPAFKPAATPAKKSKSKLSSFLSGKKDKDTTQKLKPPQSPASSKKSTDSSDSKKDRLFSKSQQKSSNLKPLQTPKPSQKTTPQQERTTPSIPHPNQLPPPSPSSRRFQFDPKVSPYRRYVLPRPTYTTGSEGSDLSSCPSAAFLVKPVGYSGGCGTSSSGYESLVTHEEGSIFSDTLPVNTETKTTARPDDHTWLTTKHTFNNNDMESEDYCGNKVKQLQKEHQEFSSKLSSQVFIEKLLCKQEQLKQEMAQAKSTLMIQSTDWSYDLHVATQRASQREGDHSAYIEALQKETETLQKRVDACKSRIMLVTSIL